MLGELVVLVVYYPENFESFASSITVERPPQCTSVCTMITQVLLLTFYLVRIGAAYLIVNLCRLADTRCNTCVVVRGVVRDCLL